MDYLPGHPSIHPASQPSRAVHPEQSLNRISNRDLADSTQSDRRGIDNRLLKPFQPEINDISNPTTGNNKHVRYSGSARRIYQQSFRMRVYGAASASSTAFNQSLSCMIELSNYRLRVIVIKVVGRRRRLSSSEKNHINPAAAPY